MPISKFLNPRNDFAFKCVFGTEKNKDILIPFLNDMLDFKGTKQIKDVVFLKTAQDPEVAAAKQSTVDVMCTDTVGRQYIVEMQVSNRTGFEKRAQYYAAKTYSRQMMKKDGYANLKEIIFLAITDFVMFPDKAAYKSNHVTLDKETYSHDLKDFSFTFLELPKFKKTIDELSNIVEKWTYFLKHADETTEQEMARLVGSDQVIERAYEALNRYAWTDIELNTYEQAEKQELDAKAILSYQREKGLEEGIAKGKAEGKQEGEVAMLLQILRLKFTDIPVALETKIKQMNAETLLAFSANVLNATSLSELVD